jgi:hypothetical protein
MMPSDKVRVVWRERKGSPVEVGMGEPARRKKEIELAGKIAFC